VGTVTTLQTESRVPMRRTKHRQFVAAPARGQRTTLDAILVSEKDWQIRYFPVIAARVKRSSTRPFGFVTPNILSKELTSETAENPNSGEYASRILNPYSARVIGYSKFVMSSP